MTYKISIIFIFTVCMFFPDTGSFGYGHDTPLYTHFCYMFFHAGYIHLISNSYAIYILLNNSIFKSKIALLSTLYVIAVITSFISYSDYPTIGSSTIAFAMAGINFPVVKDKKRYLKVFPAFILIGFLIPHINALSHAVSAMMGILIGVLKHGYDRRKHKEE